MPDGLDPVELPRGVGSPTSAAAAARGGASPRSRRRRRGTARDRRPGCGRAPRREAPPDARAGRSASERRRGCRTRRGSARAPPREWPRPAAPRGCVGRRFSSATSPQIVEPVGVDVVELPDSRLEVARHGEIEKEHRRPAPLPHRRLDGPPSTQRAPGSRSCRRRRRPRAARAADPPTAPRSTADAAPRAPRHARPARGWRRGRPRTPAPAACSAKSVPGLPRAEDEDGALRQVAEHLRRELEADRRHRQRMPRDLGLGAHALAGRDGASRTCGGARPRRPGLPRQRGAPVRTWPSTSLSPSASESRPAATRKRWRAASPPSR